MVRRSYELTLGAHTYELRLNSFQLAGYLRTNFDQATAPIVGVLLAIERLDLLLDLLARALKGAGQTSITGPELYDLLVDEGWSTVDFARLVVHIAVESGVIAPDMEQDYLKAVAEGDNGALGQARALLNALSGKGQEAPETPEADKEVAGPTN